MKLTDTNEEMRATAKSTSAFRDAGLPAVTTTLFKRDYTGNLNEMLEVRLTTETIERDNVEGEDLGDDPTDELEEYDDWRIDSCAVELTCTGKELHEFPGIATPEQFLREKKREPQGGLQYADMRNGMRLCEESMSGTFIAPNGKHIVVYPRSILDAAWARFNY